MQLQTRRVLTRHPNVAVQWKRDKNYCLIATETIPVGDVLLVETPLVSWTRGDYDPVRALISIAKFPHVVKELQSLSPETIQSLSDARYEQAKNELLKSGSFKMSSEAEIDDLVRLYYVFETNSFPSGLFLAIARCNHSCNPNAEVMEHGDSKHFVDVSDSIKKTASISETEAETFFYTLSATRELKAGDEICISYLDNPGNMYRNQRQRQLSTQYHFDCACEKCNEEENE